MSGSVSLSRFVTQRDLTPVDLGRRLIPYGVLTDTASKQTGQVDIKHSPNPDNYTNPSEAAVKLANELAGRIIDGAKALGFGVHLLKDDAANCIRGAGTIVASRRTILGFEREDGEMAALTLGANHMTFSQGTTSTLVGYASVTDMSATLRENLFFGENHPNVV